MKTLKTELKELIKYAGKNVEHLLKLRGMHPECEREIEVYEAAKGYHAAAKLAFKKGDVDAALTAIKIQDLCVDAYLRELSLFSSQFRTIYEERIGEDLLRSEPGSRNQPSEDGAEGYCSNLYVLEDLIKRYEQREKEGFPKKTRLREVIRPVKSGKSKEVVPVTEEEMFYHDPSDEPEEIGGSGEGEEGDVVGEKQVREEQGSGSKPGGDGLGEHDFESRAYEVGKYLTQLWKLPDIQAKQKKKSVPKDTYDLTDKNRRSGQFLDENATLDEIIKRDIARQNKSSD